MKISILTTAHNEEEHILECLRSVETQTHSDVEHIVVCDSCTDDTETIVRSFGIDPIVVDYRSTGLSLNAALSKVTGDYWMGLGGDDYLATADSLRVLHDRIAQDPVDVLSFGCYFGSRVASCFYEGKRRPWPNVAFNLFRTDSFERGGFPDSSYTEDQAWFFSQVGEHARIDFIDVPIYQYRYPQEHSAVGTVHHRNVNDRLDLFGREKIEALTTIPLRIFGGTLAETLAVVSFISDRGKYLLPPIISLVVDGDTPAAMRQELQASISRRFLDHPGAPTCHVVSKGEFPVENDGWGIVHSDSYSTPTASLLRSMAVAHRYIQLDRDAAREAAQTVAVTVERDGITRSLAEQRLALLSSLAGVWGKEEA